MATYGLVFHLSDPAILPFKIDCSCFTSLPIASTLVQMVPLFCPYFCRSRPSVLPPHLAPLQMWFHGLSGSFPGSPPEPLQVYLTNVACSDMLPIKTLVNSQCIMIKIIICLWFIGFLSVSLRCTER